MINICYSTFRNGDHRILHETYRTNGVIDCLYWWYQWKIHVSKTGWGKEFDVEGVRNIIEGANVMMMCEHGSCF